MDVVKGKLKRSCSCGAVSLKSRLIKQKRSYRRDGRRFLARKIFREARRAPRGSRNSQLTQITTSAIAVPCFLRGGTRGRLSRWSEIIPHHTSHHTSRTCGRRMREIFTFARNTFRVSCKIRARFAGEFPTTLRRGGRQETESSKDGFTCRSVTASRAAQTRAFTSAQYKPSKHTLA